MHRAQWSAAVFVVAATIAPGAARAQCAANVSSCTTCHETRGAASVRDDGTAWHRDHAFGDFCAGCHGGDVEASEEGAAHARLVAPLSDPATRCEPCHAGNGPPLLERYRSMRGTGTNAVQPVRPRAIAAPPLGSVSSRGRNAFVAALAILLGAGGITFVVRNERRIARGGRR